MLARCNISASVSPSVNGGLESEALCCRPGGAGCQATPALRQPPPPDHPEAYAAVGGSVTSNSMTPGPQHARPARPSPSPRVCLSSHPVNLNTEEPTELFLRELPGLGHSSPQGGVDLPARGHRFPGTGAARQAWKGGPSGAEAEAQGCPARNRQKSWHWAWGQLSRKARV